MTFDQAADRNATEDGAAAQFETTASTSRTRRGRAAALPRLISLFSGAGGMDLGFHQAGYRVDLAIDASSAAMSSFAHNFPRAKAVTADLTLLKPSGVLRLALERVPRGSAIGVIGGPPCQGFSRANNGSTSSDPRNLLPKLYVEVVKELQKAYDVQFLVIENVPGITDRKHAETYHALVKAIGSLGFNLHEKLVCALDHGVPQKRQRVILTGLRADLPFREVALRKRSGPRTVADAIAGLKEPQYFERGLNSASFPEHPNHWTMKPLSSRFQSKLEPSSKRRSFKKLTWDAPSPTIAFGNREIHVHPSGHRRLSIYEAMLLQGFPADFQLKGNLSEQVLQISNAVPPPLARSVALAISRAMECK